MKKASLILSVDLGTTGNRAMAFSQEGFCRASSYAEFTQIFPHPGWVEHDPELLWKTALKVIQEVVQKVGADSIYAIGITNQRETTLIWNKHTGKPVYNAIVWQCRRTSALCKQLKPYAPIIKQKTGLFLDPYFSATKIQWILDTLPQARLQAEKGDLLFGTVDTWILWKLTGGKVHATDPSNASRTMLYNIHTLSYDPELLNIFHIPAHMLPEVRPTFGPFGMTDKAVLHSEIPIMGVIGDQQAAFFAQGGWEEGVVKNTYGTGLFVVASTGDLVPESGKLVNTIAWQQNKKVTYAVEGSIFIGGAAIQWLRDGLGIIQHASETEPLAKTLKDNEGVYFVPALTGLGAPYWVPEARGILTGLTRGTGKAHIVRAALESMAYQTRDVIEEIQAMGVSIDQLKVDGGACKNHFLMQFQADLLAIPVEKPKMEETTAFGAAGVAGIASEFWTYASFSKCRKRDSLFTPSMIESERNRLYSGWKEAVQKCL